MSSLWCTMTYRECEKQGQKQIKRPSYSLGRATVFSKEAAAFMIMLDLVKIINIAKFETAVRSSNGLCLLDLDNFADFVA